MSAHFTPCYKIIHFSKLSTAKISENPPSNNWFGSSTNMEIQRTNKRGKIVFCCMLLLLSFLVVVSNSESTQEETIEADRLKNNNNNFPSKWKMLSSPPWLTLIDHWEAIKNKCLAKPPSVLKPNSGFREDKEEGGAVGKSLEKAKETIVDSAKSAAKMAKEAADGLKNTKSYKTDPQDEL